MNVETTGFLQGTNNDDSTWNPISKHTLEWESITWLCEIFGVLSNLIQEKGISLITYNAGK